MDSSACQASSSNCSLPSSDPAIANGGDILRGDSFGSVLLSCGRKDGDSPSGIWFGGDAPGNTTVGGVVGGGWGISANGSSLIRGAFPGGEEGGFEDTSSVVG